ncbi:MAG: tyrosine-type recombinase/integrase [Candidatus Bathyarchaeia archaeon]
MVHKAEKFLRVRGWESGYQPVNNLLLHLIRKSKSEGTKTVYLWHLYKFCRFLKKTPRQLVLMKRNEAEKAIQCYADSFKDVSRSYANISICALKCFYAVNGFRRNRALDLELYYQPPRHRLTQEYVPTKAEVYRMADSARSLRDRAIMLMLFSSGLRNSTLRALRVKDLSKELLAGVENPIIPIYPDMKQIDPAACKGGIPYYTFLCDEGSQALRLYLEDRKQRFGQLCENEPLFCTEYNQIHQSERRTRPITSRELQIIVKDAARRAGVSKWLLVHPHVLRKSYETILRGQLIDGSNLDVKTQEYFMGHILAGSQDNYYDSSKVESMRILYSNLRFGRAIIENKFRLLRAAVGRAFEGTDVDPDEIILQYAANKKDVDIGP